MMVLLDEARLDAEGVLHVSGWAAGPASVAFVEVRLDGVKLGHAEYGHARPDVAQDYPGFVGVATCGFALAAKLGAKARQAAVQAQVVVVASDGAIVAAVRDIARGEGPDFSDPATDELEFNCDSIGLFDDGALEIAGWAAHEDGVGSLEVSLDGALLGACEVGRDRPDVGKSLAHIPSARWSGFDFRHRVANLAAGEHDIRLVFRTRKGGRLTRKLKAAVQIAAEPGRVRDREDIRLFIDTPAIVNGALAQPVRRMLSVEGWAIARHGVAAIEVFLDGAPVGSAARGNRRLDIAAAYPEWPEALTSGFTILLPRKLFGKDRHTLRISLRDKRGETQDVEVRVAVEPADLDDERTQLRARPRQAEIDLKAALIAAAPARPAFAALLLANEAGAEDIERTLESLREQCFADFSVALLAPTAPAQAAARAAAERAGVTLHRLDEDGDLAAALERLTAPGEERARFFLRLRAGDRLGPDALMEFALEIATRPQEELIYADDRRFEAGAGRVSAFLKPDWSPDLLLSMNYLGRAWCAALPLAARAGLSVRDLAQASDYDIALRLSEAARGIVRVPLVLAQAAPAGDSPAREQAALRDAMARRGISGGVRATAAPGVWRLRRKLRTRGLVSIIIPSIGARGLIETCLDSIRARTAYRNFEIVIIDNIEDPASPWKEWFKQQADCVVEYSGPFNWSKLNNFGAEAALGDYLLFLNDDVEAIEPRWLHALLEHAERDEVGVVGPRLLYPDGRVQHAGMFLADGHARHAFRFAEDEDFGAFGLGAAQRNVAAVTGACLLTRREVFAAIGGFDEGHVVVNNDIDMCLKLWRDGWRVVYTPHATLIHHEMASRAGLPDSFDERGFAAAWRNAFALGDPFFHPGLSLDDGDYAPDPEPARAIVAGRPLVAREDVRRILVQKLDHVGDFITGLPAIQRLKQRFPQAEIHVMASSASAALARLEPAIDNVIEFNFFHHVSSQGRVEHADEVWLELEQRLKPYRFDLAIDLRKHTETRDLLKHSGARFTAGFDVRGAYPWLDIALEWDTDQPYLPKRAQVADDYVALAETVSLACERDRRVIAGPSAEAALAELRAAPWVGELRAGLFDRPVVGVHPAAGNVLRQWPPGHFAQLIDLICDAYDVNVALLGAPGEAAIAAAVLAETRASDRVWSLVGRTKLGDTPQLMRAMRLFVGNNSGPHHIAAAMGTPTVGVHSGVVSAREWGPLGPMAIAVQREMTCGPCYIDKPALCPRGLACLQGLRPGAVFRICEQMLGATSRRV
ncbi:MAG: glycosyltransferase [Pseudomonadota bacterium]|nr:glycosyltransferase [Pseudomonadota bacterium]